MSEGQREASGLTGLTDAEADAIRKKTGRNTVHRGKKQSPLRIFAGQLGDLMTMILLVCAGLSVLMGEGTEALAMMAIVLVNALIGFLQEYRTERTLEALTRLAAPTARVIRQGIRRGIPAEELVPGDLVLIAAGDKIPADCRILGDGTVSCDEALLTGESVPVEKSRLGDADLKMGALALKGSCQAQVTAIGMQTEMGKIAGMLEEITPEMTPLAQRLEQLSKVIAAGCLGICAVVAAIGMLRGENPFDMILMGISLAVAAVPEGLPAIVTVALALAVRKILRRGTLVKNLHAVETLGCAQVICTDKTGTLTQNRMTVRELWTAGGVLEVTGEGDSREGTFFRSGRQAMELRGDEALLLTAFSAANAAALRPGPGNRWKTDGDPTETALLIAAAKAGIHRKPEEERSVRAFDSRRKLMSVTVQKPEGSFVFAKGAPDLLLPRCSRCRSDGRELPLDEAFRRRVQAQADRFAEEGRRVIAAAYKPVDAVDPESGLIFLGLAALTDPPRPDAARAVRECLSAHIRPVMITGDHSLTARAIAREVGILRLGCDQVLTGQELDQLTEEELARQLPRTAVFARVTPAHKLRIVRAFKSQGLVTAMTGDGVNDAPALKEADIGAAMGESGSDVAREAADLVLLDDNFSTLVEAVREGRTIYANIRRSIRYLLSCNTGEVTAMLFGMLLGMPVVLTPVQLLLVNLATDGLPAVALGFEPPEEGIMQQHPRGREDSIFSGGLLGTILLRGLLIGFCTLGAYTAMAARGSSLESCRTAALLTLIFTQLIHCFECKSERRSLFTVPVWSNPRLVLAVAASALMAVFAVTNPWAMAVMGTVRPDRALCLTVAAACMIGPVLWGLTGVLFRPRTDDTAEFCRRAHRLKVQNQADSSRKEGGQAPAAGK